MICLNVPVRVSLDIRVTLGVKVLITPTVLIAIISLPLRYLALWAEDSVVAILPATGSFSYAGWFLLQARTPSNPFALFLESGSRASSISMRTPRSASTLRYLAEQGKRTKENTSIVAKSAIKIGNTILTTFHSLRP